MSGHDAEEIRRRQRQAEFRCRQQRELHQQMFQDELEVEKLIKETEAENKCLTAKVKELQLQVADLRRRSKQEDEEEALRHELLSEEKRIVHSQSIQIRKMEKENQKLKEQNEDLTAQLDQLSLGRKYQEEIQNLRRAEQEIKCKLEEVQEVLRHKDEEIEMKSKTLITKKNKIEEYFKTIEDLRRDKQELQHQQSRIQEEQIKAFQGESTTSNTRQPLDSDAADEDEEHEDNSWWSRAKGLWKGVKVAGAIGLCVLLPVCIMVSEVPLCNNPDTSLCSIVVDLLEPYIELHHTFPPVY